MKYRLKKDIGTLKAGTILEYRENTYICSQNAIYKTDLVINEKDIPQFIADGTIEEVEEKKWTDSDMLDFANYCHSYMDMYNDDLNNWLKQRGNQ